MGKKKKKESAEDKLYNLQAQQLAAQVANWAAQLDFQKERFRLLEMPQFQQGLQLEVDKFAWEKGQQTWERAYQEALLTGMYQGQPTTQWLMDQARLTGSYNGERTLEGRLTDAQIQDMQDKMKLANDQFVSATTGYYNGQKTFDREKFEAAQALEGWKFIATLSGPQNAFKQARAIASIPGGVSGFMQAFAGQYMMPSGGAVGSGGQASLNDLTLGFGGMYSPQQAQQAYLYETSQHWPGPGPSTAPTAMPGPQAQAAPQPQPQPQPQAAGYEYSPPGVQAPANAWNYSATPNGSVAAYPPGVVSPPQTADVSSNAPINPATVAPTLNQPQAYQYGGATAAAPVTAPQTSGNAMLLPNQINAENYGNAYQYQQELLWAQYEDQGWDKGLAQEAFLKSLPKYGGPTKGTISF